MGTRWEKTRLALVLLLISLQWGVCVCVYVCAVWDLPWALHGPEVSQSKHLNTQQLSSKLMTESLQPKVEFRSDGMCTTSFCSHGT